MTTTIQISEQLQEVLTERKFFDRETYEEVIWDLLEDHALVNEETKKDIALSRAQVKKGKKKSLETLEAELDL